MIILALCLWQSIGKIINNILIGRFRRKTIQFYQYHMQNEIQRSLEFPININTILQNYVREVYFLFKLLQSKKNIFFLNKI